MSNDFPTTTASKPHQNPPHLDTTRNSHIAFVEFQGLLTRSPPYPAIPSSDHPKTLRDLPTKMGSKNWRLVFPWWIDNYVAPVYIYIYDFVQILLVKSYLPCLNHFVCVKLQFSSIYVLIHWLISHFFYCHRWNFHLCSVDLDCVLLVGEMSISVGHKPPCFPSLLGVQRSSAPIFVDCGLNINVLQVLSLKPPFSPFLG